MNMLVFIGPSLPLGRLSSPPSYSRAPPIKRGDLDGTVEYDPIVIIDGEFGQSLSVSPKEILRVIKLGKTVIGSASMGALRASELDVFGMIGVGWIYKRFAKASIRRDEDVALLYSPLDFQPLTVPMINIKYWMSLAVLKAQTTLPERNRVIKLCYSIFYSHRTPEVVYEIFVSTVGAARFDSIVDELGGLLPDIKQIDAALAISVAPQMLENHRVSKGVLQERKNGREQL